MRLVYIYSGEKTTTEQQRFKHG